MERNFVILGYIAFILVNALFLPYAAANIGHPRIEFNMHWIKQVAFLCGLVAIPFIILTIFAYRKSWIFVQSFVKGLIIWFFIFLQPLLVIGFVVVSKTGETVHIFPFSIIQFVISALLIHYYSLSKGYIFPALILPGVWNLYLLVYGTYQKNR